MMMNDYYNYTNNGFNEAQGIVSQMNVDALQRLMNDDDELKRLVRNFPEIQQTETIKESIKENIRCLALRNLEKEPILIYERQKLAELHAQLGPARDYYKTIRETMDHYDESNDTSPEMIYILLHTAASELERETEQTAEDFFYGEKTEEEVTNFERRFIEDRRRAHELKIKAEKFHELMQQTQATSHLNSNQYLRSDKRMLEIRHEDESDRNEIYHIHQNAFQRDDEAQLVEKLRKNKQFNRNLSFVVLIDNKIVGHVLFTPIKINYLSSSMSISSLALAPISILSEYQKQGIGSQLINYALNELKLQGFSSIIVLGHEHFYVRFGFLPARMYKIRAPFTLENENCFMALELKSQTFPMTDDEGVVQYLPEFGL